MFVERSSQVRATKNTWPYYRYRETAGKLNLVIAQITWALDGVVQLIKALNYFPTVSLPEYDIKYSYKNPH